MTSFNQRSAVIHPKEQNAMKYCQCEENDSGTGALAALSEPDAAARGVPGSAGAEPAVHKQ